MLFASLACSSSGGSSPASPTGLFLRPTGDANTKVYSNGRGLLLHVVNNEIVIGTFDHDALNPYNIEDEDDGAGDGDDISVGYSYSLAANAGDDYSNTLFSTNNNQLTFIGENSGVLGETPPYKLSIETALNVKIALPATFNGYINTDASNDDTDADTRKFAFSGGTISKTDVAATGEVPAHRTISVTAGKIYAPDTKAGTGKIINFEALDSYKLPTTPDIYEYYVIVTDENNDGTGEVRAMAALPTGTGFYVIGEVEELMVPESITFRELKFTDKDGGVASYDIKIKYALKSGSDDMPEVAVDGSTISIVVGLSDTYKELLDALNGNSEVTALVNVEAGSVYAAGRSLINGNLVKAHLSGGANAVPDGAAATKAQIEIGGLIVQAANAGAGGNNIFFAPRHTNAQDSAVTFTVNGNRIDVLYGDMATLADLITAIDGNTAVNGKVDFDTTGISQDALDSTLLVDVFFATHSFAEDDNSRTLKTSTEDPIANPTGDLQDGKHDWISISDETLDTEDYLINLGP